MTHPKPWRHIRSEELQNCKVFSVERRALVESPHTGDHHDFYRIEADDWVNVVPVTPTGEIVMVRQFRHGARHVTLEVPGGIVDPGETPSEAAAREVLEETGYCGEDPIALGAVNPNPALFGNQCHSFWIANARPVAEIQNGATEETVVELVPGDQLEARLRAGDITHALVIACLHFYHLARTTQNHHAKITR